MSTPAQAPPQQVPPGQQPPPPDDGLDDAAVALAIAELLLIAASAAVLIAALRLRFRMSAALWSGLEGAAGIAMENPPPVTGVIGAASAQTSRQNLVRRAQFVLSAGKRLAGDVREARAKGEPVGQALLDGLARERRYYNQHTAAMWNRATAAGKTDMAAAEYGPLLSWNAVMDARTSAECRNADGKNYYATAMPDIGFPGSVHPHCFPAGTEVASSSLRAIAMRRYRGELIELTTLRGHRLAVTPNHPVLTPQGWIAAGLLDEGCEVVSTRFGQSLLMLIDPDDHQEPALIEDVLRSFSEHLGVLSVPVPVAAEDFHGDGTAGEVAEVWADRMLMGDLESSRVEPSRVQKLSGIGRHRAMQLLRARAPLLPGVLGIPHGLMGREDVARILLGGPASHHELVGLGNRAAGNPVALQDGLDNGAGGSVCLRELVLAGATHVRDADEVLGHLAHHHAGRLSALTSEVVGGPLITESSARFETFNQRPPRNIHLVGNAVVSEVAGLVEFDRLIKVRRRAAWSGHVFNLESSLGWLITDNIISHNCRCFPGPPHPDGRLLPSRGARNRRAP